MRRKAGGMMIRFQDILKLLSEHGWSTYRLIKEKRISSGTITRIRKGQSVSTDTIDTICGLCDCQPGDLMEYVPDQDEE